MGATDNLRHVADAVAARAKEAGGAAFEAPVRRLHQAAQRVGLAWCGSWLPGMANLYGQALQPTAGGLPRPPEVSGSGRIGWVEWTPDDIRRSIHQTAGQPDVQQLLTHAARAAVSFEQARADSLPVLADAVAAHANDAVLDGLQRDAQQLRLVDHDSLLDSWRPSCKSAVGNQRSGPAPRAGAADSRAWEVPAHLSELAAIEALRSPLLLLQTLASLLRRAAEHCKSLVQQAAHAQQLARSQALALPLSVIGRVPGQPAQHAEDVSATASSAQPQARPLHLPLPAPLASPSPVTFAAVPPTTPAGVASKLGRSAFARVGQSPFHQLLAADNAAGNPRHAAGAHAAV